MLSLLACFGCQPCKTFETSIQLYSKLGGIFLGVIQRPCLKHEDAYLVLRKLQDQVATWLRHPKMPPRYLALFVGTLRLTSPDFPFVYHLGVKSSRKVLDSLGKALWIDALWDEDLVHTKIRLAAKDVDVAHCGNSLTTYRLRNFGGLPDELLPLELEAFRFHADIHEITAHHKARRLGRINLFPDLKRLNLGSLLDFDFEQTSKTKRLTFLRVCLPTLGKDVGLMLGLQTLSVKTSNVGCIPTTIGLLTRLTRLVLMGGFTQTIPPEVGNLVELKKLTIQNTKLSGSIPSELCKLTKLSSLELSHNFRLEGSLPEEFCNLKLLSCLNLHDTPVETNGFLHGWRHHKISKSESFWERQV